MARNETLVRAPPAPDGETQMRRQPLLSKRANASPVDLILTKARSSAFLAYAGSGLRTQGLSELRAYKVQVWAAPAISNLDR